MKKFRLKLAAATALCILLFASYIAGLQVYVVQHDKSFGVYREGDARIPVQKVGLVLGAGVGPGSELSALLKARVDTGIALYEEGKVTHLVLSGDNSRKNYDEPTAMRDYILKTGKVPVDKMTIDYAGFSTFDSCYRLRHVFGIESSVTVVSQEYHVPRALHICRQFMSNVVGVATTRYWDLYDGGIEGWTLREYPASVKAFLMLHVIRTTAVYAGPPEPIVF
jgi:vancomycin permeability regulator SanA